jgi:N-acetylmuramoyl-L-alanine amidase
MNIALFPGHHGKDSGAVNEVNPSQGDRYHTLEVSITPVIVSKLSLMCKMMGIAHSIGIGSFEERLSSTAGSDAGIEIHCDSLPSSPAIRGFHTIFYPGSEQGEKLARWIDFELDGIARRARGPHGMGNLAMLRRTAFPMVIVECGFISNPEEEALLLNDEYQWKLAFGICAGLMKWMAKNDQ